MRYFSSRYLEDTLKITDPNANQNTSDIIAEVYHWHKKITAGWILAYKTLYLIR